MVLPCVLIRSPALQRVFSFSKRSRIGLGRSERGSGTGDRGWARFRTGRAALGLPVGFGISPIRSFSVADERLRVLGNEPSMDHSGFILNPVWTTVGSF